MEQYRCVVTVVVLVVVVVVVVVVAAMQLKVVELRWIQDGLVKRLTKLEVIHRRPWRESNLRRGT